MTSEYKVDTNAFKNSVKTIETNLLIALNEAFNDYRRSNIWTYLEELEKEVYKEKSSSFSDIFFNVATDFLFTQFCFKPAGKFLKGIVKHIASNNDDSSLKHKIIKHEIQFIQSVLSNTSLQSLTIPSSGETTISKTEFKSFNFVAEAVNSITTIKNLDSDSPESALKPVGDFLEKFYSEVTGELKKQISDKIFPRNSSASLINEISIIENEVRAYKVAMGEKIGIFFNGIIAQVEKSNNTYWAILFESAINYSLRGLSLLQDEYRKYFEAQFQLFAPHVFFINKTIFQCNVNYTNGILTNKKYPALSLIGMKNFAFLTEKQIENFRKYVFSIIGPKYSKIIREQFTPEERRNLINNGCGLLTISCELTKMKIHEYEKKIVNGVMSSKKKGFHNKFYLTLVGKYVVYDSKSKCENINPLTPPVLSLGNSSSSASSISANRGGGIYYGLFVVGEKTEYHPSNFKKNIVSFYPSILNAAKTRAGSVLKEIDLDINNFSGLPVSIDGKSYLNNIID